jgi:NAD(P)-dependent dehydrogenase (short-subunit alcohol dehydrogenase family)
MSELLSGADFEGKHVFVAGGSSGINLGIAERFAEQGARVSICSRSPERVEAAVGTLLAHGSGAMGTPADVRQYDQVAAALKAAADAFGDIDVLVSGAAGNFVAPALGMSANAFKTVVDIDLLGTFNVFRAGYDHLTKPGASLIAISAPQAIHPYAYQAHVCAAKAGIDMLVRALAVEWGPDGVRVNAIIPGPIADTEGMKRLAPTPEAEQRAIQGTPLRRYGTKAEIGDAALFLSSPMAAYITGAQLPVDGGATLMGASRMGEAMEMAFQEAAKQRAE